jgi:BMFP domain-containing protein YqiC
MLDGVAGVGGAAPRLIYQEAMAAVVSEFEGETVSVTRENVLAHERVVSRVLAQTTPLPFRFGTLASAERIQSYVTSQMSSLKAALEHVRGTVEMSVKIIWDAVENRREALAGEAGKSRDGVVNGAGTKFMMAKRREIVGDERLQMRADELSAWLAGALREVVRESSVELRPAESLVLSASHLVAREKVENYRVTLEKARRERQDLHFLTSGPWPPYSFSNLFS